MPTYPEPINVADFGTFFNLKIASLIFKCSAPLNFNFLGVKPEAITNLSAVTHFPSTSISFSLINFGD